MRIAVEGCSHGELDIIYKTIAKLEQLHKFKIDLLLCCGDFQAVRNEQDLKCMAVPLKYMKMQDFHKYYAGEKVAPVLTIFIGGNHEASNYLQELPYGGWVAPNIYYMGYASIVNVGGLRIGGLSGIYKGSDYLKGHYEKTPYDNSSIRSVYHIRNLEIFRLKQVSNCVDIFLSHDWPRGIYQHGNAKKLLKVKPHFRNEVEANTLGSRPAEELLKKLCPSYWFSGHLHVKFAALLTHEGEATGKITKFLALDKCLPRREFLQVLEIANPEFTGNLEISHDPEWLTILRLTNHFLSTRPRTVYMPGPGSNERYKFSPSPEEIEETLEKMGGSLIIPGSSFVQTSKCFSGDEETLDMSFVQLPEPLINPQTSYLCTKLGVDDPVVQLDNKLMSSGDSSIISETSDISFNPDEIDITDVDDENENSDVTGEDCHLASPLSQSQDESVVKNYDKLSISRESISKCLSSSVDLQGNSDHKNRQRLSLSKPCSSQDDDSSLLGEEGVLFVPPSGNVGMEKELKIPFLSEGICLSTNLEVTPSEKRASYVVEVDSPLSDSKGSSGKKLKRRNVSLYANEDD